MSRQFVPTAIRLEKAMKELQLSLQHNNWDEARKNCDAASSEILHYILEKNGHYNTYTKGLEDLYDTCSRCVYYVNMPLYRCITYRQPWTPVAVQTYAGIVWQMYETECLMR